MNSFACGELRQHCPCFRDSAQNFGSGKTGSLCIICTTPPWLVLFRKICSLPAQSKPYPPLAQVTADQPEFVMENVSGRIVGFRSPAYVKGVGVPGYHLHFISDDHTQGGHILGFEMTNGAGAIDVCDRLLLILPGDDALFGAADLSVDRAKELEAVEK